MSFHFSPNIVTDGLILCYDPANTRSFVSGSTSLFDLTSNKYNALLTGGTTYSGTAMGSISLDSTNDSIGFSNIGDLTDGTVSMWFRNNDPVTTATTTAFLFEFTSAATLTNQTFTSVLGNVAYATSRVELLSVYLWGDISSVLGNYTADDLPISGSTIPVGWHNLVVARDSVGTRVYFDNVLLGAPSQGTNISIIPTSTIPFIYSLWNWNLNKIGRVLGGLVSHFTIYNRGITTEEVSRNYNALKNRFGL
jgi:hypothetical protein